MRRSDISNIPHTIHKMANEVSACRMGRANRILVNRKFMVEHGLQIPDSQLIHTFSLEQYPSLLFLYHDCVENYMTAFYHGNNLNRAPQLCIHEKYIKDKFISPVYFGPVTRYVLRYHLDTKLVSDYFVTII